MRRPASWTKTSFSTWLLPCLASAAAYAGGPPEGQIHGELTETHGVRILRVWGPPDARGYAHGYLLAPNIVALLDGYVADGEVGGGELGYRFLLMPMTGLMCLSPSYGAELRGMLAGIEARLGGLPNIPALARTLRYEDLVAINCIPDMALFGCSSFAVWGPLSEDGKTLAGRNLDWRRAGALDGTQIVVAYGPQPASDRMGWVSITWPGYIGCLTGMNADGVTVSMHDVRGVAPSVTTGFTPRGLALRDAIESARAQTAIADIARVLRTRHCAVGNNVSVTMPYTGGEPPSAVFEYDGALDRSEGITVRDPDEATRSYQICTNHYVKRDVPKPCGRYEAIRARLTDLAGRGEKLDGKGAWRLLSAVARPDGHAPERLTYQSVVFEPNERRLQVAFSSHGRPAPERPELITLKVDDLLDPASRSSEGP